MLPYCNPFPTRLPCPCPTRATDDRKARELIDTKNQADSMVYQTEKQLKEFADKVRGGGRSCGWQQTGAVSGSRHEAGWAAEAAPHTGRLWTWTMCCLAWLGSKPADPECGVTNAHH